MGRISPRNWEGVPSCTVVPRSRPPGILCMFRKEMQVTPSPVLSSLVSKATPLPWLRGSLGGPTRLLVLVISGGMSS